MSAAEIFVQMAMDIFNHLGVPVTYTPVAGTPIPGIKALMPTSLRTQPSGMNSETWGQYIMVELMQSDLPAGSPAPGDTVSNGIDTYTLIAPLENNGLLVKWVVT